MHRDWYPLGDVSVAQFDQSFGPLILPGSAFLAAQDGRVVGVGCLMRARASGPPMRPLISMLGPTDPRLPHARELSADLVARCLGFARSREKEIEAEADDANTALVPVLEEMPATIVGELLQLTDG